MTRIETMRHEFVTSAPKVLEPGVLYVSIEFATALHKCCCGCGREVITPFSPAQWSLTFDGRSVTLHPSIGNWNFPCKSHYWIRRNRVVWGKKLSAKQIKVVREADVEDLEELFAETRPSTNRKGLRAWLARRSRS